MPSVRPLLLLLVASLLAGCSTFESRAKERPGVLSSLDGSTQNRLKEGNIAVGDTADMVYIALGEPDSKSTRTDASGTQTTWVYSTRWDEYQGTVVRGYRRVVLYDRASKRYFITYEPVRTDVYAEREEERLRIDFKDAKVTAIEQTKD
jgi:outer membrane protein assembly factor BamE (lipoprotein component of BamABCDE complex)